MRRAAEKPAEAATLAAPAEPLTAFTALPYQRPRPAQLLNRARRLRRQLQRFTEADELEAAIRDFDVELRHFAESCALAAALVHLGAGEEGMADDLAVVEDRDGDLLQALHHAYQPLLVKEDKAELARPGHHALIRTQNLQAALPLFTLRQREEERALLVRALSLLYAPADQDLEAPDEATVARVEAVLGLASIHGLSGRLEQQLIDLPDVLGLEASRRRELLELRAALVELRHEQALQQGFARFRELALARLAAYNYEARDIEAAWRLCVRWLSPVAEALRGEALVAGTPTFAELLTPTAYLAGPLELSEAARSDLTAALDAAMAGLPAELAAIWRALREGEYIQLASPEAEPAGPVAYDLPEQGSALVVCSPLRDATDLLPLLEAIGEAIALAGMPSEGQLLIERRLTLDTRLALRRSFVQLALPLCVPLLEAGEEGVEALRRAHIAAELQTLRFLVLLDRMEDALDQAMMRDEEPEAVSDPDDWWEALTEAHYVDLDAHPHSALPDWLALQQPYLAPFATRPRAVALLTSLAVAERALDDPAPLFAAWSRMAARGQDGRCLDLLSSSGLADPLAEATIKRLAYRLAYYFEY